jgi:hypothetical protein
MLGRASAIFAFGIFFQSGSVSLRIHTIDHATVCDGLELVDVARVGPCILSPVCRGPHLILPLRIDWCHEIKQECMHVRSEEVHVVIRIGVTQIKLRARSRANNGGQREGK